MSIPLPTSQQPRPQRPAVMQWEIKVVTSNDKNTKFAARATEAELTTAAPLSIGSVVEMNAKQVHTLDTYTYKGVVIKADSGHFLIRLGEVLRDLPQTLILREWWRIESDLETRAPLQNEAYLEGDRLR